MAEHEEQVAVCEYLTLLRIPHFAIPNGMWVNGGRNKFAYLKKRTAEGVKKGVPDLFIALPNKHFAGLFIEMKYGKNTLSEEQAEWLRILTKQGYKAVCCYGYKEAIKEIENYIKEL